MNQDKIEDKASGGTLLRLVIFTVCLGIAPLGSYFASLKYLWDGNDTWAAITAVVAANVVLGAFIITSLLEDSSPGAIPTEMEPKKQR
ncbi:hypothetical protein C8J56DRAFT_934881 [Mycena floridula]|nr:hypothetical protein C8J56DRAFT_934881 [Mycena floridula]